MEVPPAVDSKYRFILLSAKRARQLQAGARPLIQTATKKPTKVAQLEVSGNLVPFANLEIEDSSDGGEPGGK
jgi:DNA-directed RNA polymerase subunit omega